jgi:hypothetical protein
MATSDPRRDVIERRDICDTEQRRLRDQQRAAINTRITARESLEFLPVRESPRRDLNVPEAINRAELKADWPGGYAQKAGVEHRIAVHRCISIGVAPPAVSAARGIRSPSLSDPLSAIPTRGFAS